MKRDASNIEANDKNITPDLLDTGRLTGKVKDIYGKKFTTNSLLLQKEGVSVRGYTDKKGRYLFFNLTPGNYRIHIGWGFEDGETFENIVVKANKTTHFNPKVDTRRSYYPRKLNTIINKNETGSVLHINPDDYAH
jgi:hypothetical protein